MSTFREDINRIDTIIKEILPNLKEELDECEVSKLNHEDSLNSLILQLEFAESLITDIQELNHWI